MKIVYRLREDKRIIQLIQDASLHRDDAGLKQTHGLFGSKVWWEHTEDGTLPVITIRGVITRVFMSGHNDWLEFEMTTDTGEKLRWTRKANGSGRDDDYKVDHKVEVDYAIQKFKKVCRALGEDSHCVLAIRIGHSGLTHHSSGTR